MVATDREKETVAFANTGSGGPAITVAPAAEHVPTDDVIKSLNITEEQTLSSKRRFVNALRKRRKTVAREQPADFMVWQDRHCGSR